MADAVSNPLDSAWKSSTLVVSDYNDELEYSGRVLLCECLAQL